MHRANSVPTSGPNSGPNSGHSSANGEYSGAVPPVIITSAYDELPRILPRPQSRSGLSAPAGAADGMPFVLVDWLVVWLVGSSKVR